MDALIVTSFIIPAIVAFVLIALLIKERTNYFPKQNFGLKKQEKLSSTPQQQFEYSNNGRKRPEDYLDFSGGTMGI